MKPNVNTGGRLRQGLLPVGAGMSGEVSSPSSSATNAQKPVSRISTSGAPPTAVGGAVGPDNTVGEVSGGKNEYGNKMPTKSAGQMPPSGESRAPHSPTSPTDKSKSTGVE